jgi:predicted RND superfamily exporter protein
MRRPDDDLPLYVPAEFEAEYLADARRTVILSAMRRAGSPSFSAGSTATAHRRGVALLAHLAALTIALVFTVVTGTWVAGVVVLIAVSASLCVTLWIITLLGRRPPHPRPPRSD